MFQAAAEACHEARAQGWEKRHADAFSTLRLHAFPLLGRLFVDRVHERDIASVLSRFWQQKPAAARKLRLRIRTGEFARVLHPREARSARWALVLRAGDAVASGASQRAIAELLLSADARERRWRVQAPALRSRVQRLVREARRMAAGGYLSMLNGR